MDHLFLPRISSLPLPRVRYLGPPGGSDPYDGGELATYAARVGWPNAEAGEFAQFFKLRADSRATHAVNVAPLSTELTTARDDEELESLLQAWLYFGFLHLVLGDVGLYDARDFIEQDRQGAYVHTRKLLEKLEVWKEIARTWHGELKETRVQKIEKGFNIARDVIGISTQTNLIRFDHAVLQSFAALYETVAVVFNEVFESSNSAWILWSSLAWLSFSPDETRKMIQQGWCPFDISLAGQDFLSASGRHFVLRLKKGEPGLHEDCTESRCCRAQINMETYRPRHVDSSCACGLVGGDAQMISESLQNNTFPVFQVVSTTTGTSIDIQPYEDGIPYVAFSHVWADGLGNPQAARLPLCQLNRLQRIADDLIGKAYVWREGKGDQMVWKERVEQRKCSLWLDTICCPPAPVGCTDQERADKHLALGKLMEVYRKADYVVVLETGLENFSVEEIGPLEAAVRIFTSPWVRRLWTFQEAALAKKVLVRFHEQRLVDLSWLWKASRELARDGPLQMRVLALNTSSHFGRLRNYYDLADTPEPDIRAVVRAIACRKVSLPADEPICLGAVFGLDNKVIAETAPEVRMGCMWRLLTQTQRGVPDSVVFSPLARLNEPGFRWAPASVLLDKVDTRLREVAMLTSDDNFTPGRLNQHGLCVSRPGWRIQHGQPPHGAPSDFFPLSLSPQPIFFLRDCDGRWLSVKTYAANGINDSDVASPGEIIKDAKHRWYLIRDERGPIRELGSARSGSRGAIGYMTTPSKGIEVFNTKVTVWITRLPPSSDIIFEASYQAAKIVLRGWNIFWLGILARIRHILLVSISMFPRRLRTVIEQLIQRLWKRIATILTERIAKDIRTASAAAFRPSRVSEAMIKNGMTVNTEHSVGLTPTVLMGRVVTALEEFPCSKEWIVD